MIHNTVYKESWRFSNKNPTTNRGGTHVLQKGCSSCSTSGTRRVKFKTKIQQHELHQNRGGTYVHRKGTQILIY